MFTSLVVSRFLCKAYVPLNSTNTKRMKLYRDKNIKELKEEVVEGEAVITDAPQIVVGGEDNE